VVLARRDGGMAVEVGEAIGAGRGVLQFGGRVERRAEGEDVRV
jgi:hypothetical protein